MFWWILLALVVVFIAVLLVRAARFKPKVNGRAAAAPCEVDAAAAVEHLAQMVRVPTVSSYRLEEFDEEKFEEFRGLLKKFYPKVFETCTYERFDHTEMLFTWKGKSSAAPVVLMAHYDVVPVEESRWRHPPFCGEVFDGELWGRGTLDTKITLMGILEAAERLIGEGFVPQNDVYFAFAGDEEVNDTGAPAAVQVLKERGVKPAMVVDEGGAVVEGVFPGVKRPMAVVGIGEKGLADLEITAKSEGGHASHPPLHSAVGVLSKAVVACEKHQFKAEITTPVREMLNTVGPYAPFGLRVVFANLWCFGGLITGVIHKLGGELNAMMRTTMAFTMARGSKQSNVMPNEATATVNLRLINSTTVEGAAEHLRRAINDPAVEVRVLHGSEASPYAQVDGEAWRTLAAAVGETWQEAIVTPYLMIACSDSRHFSEICRNVYKFSAMALSGEQRGLIHNDDERVELPTVAKTVEFFTRLIQKL